VIYKLLAFTAAMVFGPISIYFLTVNTIFRGQFRNGFLFACSNCSPRLIYVLGNSTFAGIAAAVTANVVLFAYIYVAWLEDQGDKKEADKAKSKKAQ